MSYTKKLYEENIVKNVQEIMSKTIGNNDITPILELIDSTLDILEGIDQVDPEVGQLWNEITSDILASVNSATSGFYRQGILTLRSVLELGCMSFFYLDHKVEFHLFKEHDAKADKYVSKLIREYNFYKTDYISSFYTNIEEVQTKRDSISEYLDKTYKDLSDVVHGRYKTLKKQDILKIEYSISDFNNFKKFLTSVVSILATMYVLKFENKNSELIKLANVTRTVVL
ncbi:hypothetical protein [Lysinibacillus sp. GbtcB16]|uniref:hypothetical protein n=1 Tax=Lysinibacillus sp. GbtcB16 TaxID=2824761 RepID=UPI001C2FE7A2|nr:hypothetical protein [Lysinibacillus sp. GbtcB16]